MQSLSNHGSDPQNVRSRVYYTKYEQGNKHRLGRRGVAKLQAGPSARQGAKKNHGDMLKVDGPATAKATDTNTQKAIHQMSHNVYFATLYTDSRMISITSSVGDNTSGLHINAEITLRCT